ncbi:MAG: FkbM family methyltransferase [Flavobacteriaceae bacterium]|jgi:FkbM family methyltransferase|uniref:FkbM family methyltransferase n=1 Tax=Candidatus Marifrigoribacter sp. Uisw_064 TaxID=3230970 RepID=UPI003AEA16CA
MIKHLKKKISTLRRKKKFKQFYGNYINEGDLCFDIGANIGNRTEIFLNLKARVVSVEPVKKTYLILKEKFGNEKNSTLLQLGIGSEAGQKDIYISTISEVCTFSELFIEKYKGQKEFNIQWNSLEPTKISTLDQLIEDYGIPVFCKIDVEGYELEVLKGLSQPLPLLSFEYNAKLKDLALECMNTLSKFDSLSYNFSPYESMKFSFKTWKNETDFNEFIKALPDEIKTGDIYVKYP